MRDGCAEAGSGAQDRVDIWRRATWKQVTKLANWGLAAAAAGSVLTEAAGGAVRLAQNLRGVVAILISRQQKQFCCPTA